MLKRLTWCLTLALMVSPAWSRAGDPVLLDVKTLPTGVVKATATVMFPVEPGILQQLLTDYAHWPDLFDTRMRMVEIRDLGGSVVTDVRIEHALLAGERRLLSESRTLPTGGMLTELKGGDFKQYCRLWMLTPVDGGKQTKAGFELLVEIETIVPDWMVALAMRQELETHFRIVKATALARARPER